MDELLDAIEDLVLLVSPEKVQAIAARVRITEPSKAVACLSSVVGTSKAITIVEQLVTAWQNAELRSDELASMLLAASHVYAKAISGQSIELVWTGPTTPFVSARRTEQALLQIINGAKQSLFITSFVAYDIPAIMKALNAASDRGVAISMLLELSKDHGGSVSFDAFARIRAIVPTSNLYTWHQQSESFIGGCVHSKVAVADKRECFITSANLTGHAMEKNMETGVIIQGGDIPEKLHNHFHALIATRVLSEL